MLTEKASIIAALKPSFIIIAVLTFIIWGMLFSVLGKSHPDEGNYLMSAYQSGKSLIPYRDFAFTQGPVYPILYSLIGKSFGFRISMFRHMNVFLHFILLLFISLSVFYLFRWTGLITFLVIYLSNPFNFYSLTVNKLYLITAFFISLGSILLLRSHEKNWIIAFAGIFFSIAAATRISTVIILVVFWLYSFRRMKPVKWLIYSFLPSFLFLVLLYLPFFLVSFDNTLFYLISFHLSRELPFKNQLMFKFDFLILLMRYYGPALIIALSYILWRPLIEPKLAYLRFLALAYLMHLFIHIPAKVPYVYEYLTPTFPLLALWLTGVLYYAVNKMPTDIWRYKIISFIAILFISGAIITGRDNVTSRSEFPLQKVRTVADYVKSITRPDDSIFSFNPAITIASRRSIYKSSESGGLVFTIDRQRCRKLNLIHYEDFMELVGKKDIPVIVITPITFDIAFPECAGSPLEARKLIWKKLRENYTLNKQFPASGLENEDVEIWIPTN